MRVKSIKMRDYFLPEGENFIVRIADYAVECSGTIRIPSGTPRFIVIKSNIKINNRSWKGRANSLRFVTGRPGN